MLGLDCGQCYDKNNLTELFLNALEKQVMMTREQQQSQIRHQKDLGYIYISCPDERYIRLPLIFIKYR